MDSSVKDFHSSATHSPPISPPESPSESPGITSPPSASPPRDIPRTEACHSLYQQEEASIGSFEVIPALASSSLFKDKSNIHSNDKNLAAARKMSEDTIDHSKFSFFPSLHQQGGGYAAQCEEESMQHHSQGGKRHYFSGWLSRPSSPALHAKENIKTFTEDSMASKQPEASSNLSVGHDQFRNEAAKLAATQGEYQRLHFVSWVNITFDSFFSVFPPLQKTTTVRSHVESTSPGSRGTKSITLLRNTAQFPVF